MNDLDNTNEALQQEPLAQTPETAQPAEADVVNESIVTEPEAKSEPEGTETQPEAAAETAEAPAEVTAEQPEAAEQPEEEPAEAPEAEEAAEEAVTQYASQADILARLKEIAESDEAVSRTEVDSLKSQFYRIHKQNTEDARQAYLEAGGQEDAWTPEPDANEPEFKQYMAVVRDKRAAQHEAEVKEQEENYTRKLAIIERIKAILATPDDVNKFYNEFKQLQQQWNDIKSVPADKVADLWKTYQANVEQFYDTLKLNNEFRAYDFKKNLELKQNICERAEALATASDVVAAFRQLQQLHQEFRETGPVERDLREQVWARFKAASTLINKRHQEYFEQRKEEEQANLNRKTELCELIESFDLEGLKTFAQWNELSQKIIDLQKEWKTIGYATQKQNQKIFERFRAACDHFFTRKSAYFKSVRENLNGNLKLKQDLLRQAQALSALFAAPANQETEGEAAPAEGKKPSWQEATQTIVDLQKRWKEIGTVPKRYSEDIWKKFNAACDAFFAAKKESNNGQYAEQRANLEKKKAIIAQLEAIDPATAEGDIRPQLRQAQADWNAVGHVPYRDKEKLYQAFRAQMDRLYNALGEGAPRRRVQRMVEHLESRGGNVRDRLQRQYEILESEIKTYENNLGFLSFSSKSKNGNKLVEDINRKVDKLRAELAELKKQIIAAGKKEDEGEEPAAE